MALELPEHDILVIVDEDELNPFGLHGKGDEIRLWLASHQLQEDIIEDARAQAIACFDLIQPLRPHPVMEMQTGEEHQPWRWLRLLLKLRRNPQWLLLFIRLDNCYIKGFMNAHDRYELAEPAREADVMEDVRDLVVASMLPGFVPVLWSVKYRHLFNCNQSEIGQKIRPLLKEPNFEVEAIQFLWNHVPGEGNDVEAKRYLGGIIFKLCEMVVRMRPHPDDPFLMERVVRGYSEACKGLLRWKESQYTTWTSNKALIRAGIYNQFGALYVIRLVISRMMDFYERIQNNNKRKNEKKKSQTHAGQKGSNNSDKGKKPGSMDDAEEEPSAGNDNFQQIGKNRVQLLEVSANFQVDGIHLFDANHAQVIYLRHKEVETFYHLDLIGPYRPISADGPVTFVIYPTKQSSQPPSKKQKVSRSTSTEREKLTHTWIPSSCDNNASRGMQIVSGSSNKNLKISYLVIPNAIEAEVKMKLFLRGRFDVEHICGYIKVRSFDYGNDYVTLFSHKNFAVESHKWINVPLHVPVVCLPCSQDLKVEFELDLMSIETENHLIATGIEFGSTTGAMEIHLAEFIISVEVNMLPDVDC